MRRLQNGSTGEIRTAGGARSTRRSCCRSMTGLRRRSQRGLAGRRPARDDPGNRRRV